MEPSVALPPPACGMHAARDDQARDDRKSARLAAERVAPAAGAQVIDSFSFARDVLRSSLAKQAGAGAEHVDTGNPEHAPVFHLDGESHRRKRSAVARFFTAKAVTTRYRDVMERTTQALLSQMKACGSARLDQISLQLAVAVAAEIVGLTNSGLAGMSSRIGATLTSSARAPRWTWLGRLLQPLSSRYHAISFFYRDVKPAIAARRKARKDDIISHLLDEGYSDKAILIECMTYAVAGMVTTREFIVMAAWYLFERDALRERFLNGDDDDQFAILDEILRLEPVASMLHRRLSETMPGGGTQIPAGALLAIDIRAVNSDESVTGACPHMLDPDRASRTKAAAGYLSFGYGAHRCPGSQVAMHETRLFLDRLMRVPGIRLERAPQIGWCEMIMSYELRDAMVACNRS
jgi:cytochrome P450